MKIRRINIKNYKSMYDSGDIYIDKEIYAFIGQNNTGKSTVLAKINKIYPNVDQNHPALNEIIDTIKDLEYGGYQFEGADASFELIVHKAFKNIKEYFKLFYE